MSTEEDPIVMARRMYARREAEKPIDNEDPIAKVRREIAEKRQRLVARQHEFFPRAGGPVPTAVQVMGKFGGGE